MALCSLALAGCGGGYAAQPWVARGDSCVRESGEGPLRRVTNRTDNELCDRKVKHRHQAYLRVERPETR
ncbi:MAG: hypothetical protein HY342_13250 [Candidatus Lambdaproteobacteria bacterium]|nr:hypothetical protein [Candidatus Lambdaproteobacteria bacterium]